MLSGQASSTGLIANSAAHRKYLFYDRKAGC